MATADQIVLHLSHGTLVVYPQEVFEVVRESPALLAKALQRGIHENKEIRKQGRKTAGGPMEATVIDDWKGLIWVDFLDGKWLVTRRNDDGTHEVLKKFDKPVNAFQSACNMRDGVQVVCPNGNFKPSTVKDICQTRSAADEIDRIMGGLGWLEDADAFLQRKDVPINGGGEHE